MSEMEEKLGAILNNPQLMQQIMAMAQAMNQSPPPEKLPEPPKKEASPSPMPGIDLGMIQKLSGLAQQTGVDREQQALLKALSPYLSRERVSKLERAMRAAKMARAASTFLNSGALQMLTGR